MVTFPEHTNTWWRQDPSENIWFEATDRQDLGANLLAPVSKNAGQKLVAFVRPGDLVLHYYKPRKSVVAYSIAEGVPYESVIRWPDRELSPERPAYAIALSHFTFFDEPLSLAEIQERDGEIRRIRGQIGRREDGASIYFPFQLRSSEPIRPSEGAYLTKLPRAVFDLFPKLEPARDLQARVRIPPGHLKTKDSVPSPPPAGGRKSVTGRQLDVRKKLAAENYAIECASRYLVGRGYTVQDVSNQASLGYDLLASRESEQVGCEVKGSVNDRVAVDLQSSEVDFAREAGEHIRSLLYVVDQIQLEDRAGEFIGVDGRERDYWDWLPAKNALTPTAFRFILPSHHLARD